MAAKWVGLVLAFGLVAACDNTSGTVPSLDSPYAPTGTDPRKEAVDSLIVGHRLMAAGEYELALKQYQLAAAQHGYTAEVLSSLGSVNLRLGRLGQAEDLLRRAVKEDDKFVPAWNNLGVVLMERNKVGEAARVFRIAFSLDSGESVESKGNLRLAPEKLDERAYDVPEESSFELVRESQGKYLLISEP